MKKFLLSLLCFVGVTASAQFMEPLILVDDEITLDGYMLEKQLPSEVQQAYGIVDFGRVKGFAIQRATTFSGEGEFEDVTDGFQFEFVPKNNGTFGHDIFLGYAKMVYDKCKAAADGGKIYNGFYDGAKEITFDQSVKVVDKKQNERKKCALYYYYKGRKRIVELMERHYKEGAGYSTLYAEMHRPWY